jgi:hypothetical protein
MSASSIELYFPPPQPSILVIRSSRRLFKVG